MKTLSIDIETYSSMDLTKCGVSRYTEAPDFNILLFGYAFDEEDVKVIDLTESDLPQEIIEALHAPDILKTAFNAPFEITCLEALLLDSLDVRQWECTQVKSYMLGLPGSLDLVAKTLGFESKMSGGMALIKYFTKPCRPTKANGGRTRNLPCHNAEKWEEFITYNAQDVRVERTVRKALNAMPAGKASDFERSVWFIDRKINARGVMVDQPFIKNAIECGGIVKERSLKRAQEITGLENPNSLAKLKDWIKGKGYDAPSLDKKAVTELLKKVEDPEVKEVLTLRQSAGKSSLTKYPAMLNAVCDDGRVRGMLQYYGASRTGRFAGRLVQVHNLPKNDLKELDLARGLVRDGDYECLEMLFDDTPNTLSQLIRTAFIAPEGYTFAVADYSAIEARVLSWLANEKWRMDVFETHGKIYEASAAQMFKVPIEEVTKGSKLRDMGKVAELALGYGGSVGALIAMGALDKGLTEEELQPLVNKWRSANSKIASFWRLVQASAISVLQGHGRKVLPKGIMMRLSKNIFIITLPSGRELCYQDAGTYEDAYGDAMKYKQQKNKGWVTEKTYGGKLVENITQAIARDCLANALYRLDKSGYDIVFHVHDEVVIETKKQGSEEALKDIGRIMSEPIDWAPGLTLTADSYETDYYRKD